MLLRAISRRYPLYGALIKRLFPNLSERRISDKVSPFLNASYGFILYLANPLTGQYIVSTLSKTLICVFSVRVSGLSIIIIFFFAKILFKAETTIEIFSGSKLS